MKSLLCIVGVLVVAVSVYCEPPPEMKKIFDECQAENGLPTGKPTGPPNFDDSKVKCSHACIMKKMGKMVDGKVSVEKEFEFFSKHMGGGDDLKEKITECANTANQQTDECEVAGAMGKCIFEKLPPPHHH